MEPSEASSNLDRLSCLVLAGGKGIRLRRVFSEGPKCMAPIAGRPFLEYLLMWLRSSGIRNVILCVGYKKSHIREHFVHGKPWGLRLLYSEERTLLGTAGAIKNAESMIDSDPFLVVNGDSILEVNLCDLLGFHRRRRALATMALASVECASRFGLVRLDAKGRIIAFLEKDPCASANGAAKEPTYINAGIYVIGKGLLEMIPRYKPVSLEKKILPRLVGRRLFGFPAQGYFVDIGILVDYQKAQRELPVRFSL